jgi:hypothetical protein
MVKSYIKTDIGADPLGTILLTIRIQMSYFYVSYNLHLMHNSSKIHQLNRLLFFLKCFIFSLFIEVLEVSRYFLLIRYFS